MTSVQQYPHLVAVKTALEDAGLTVGAGRAPKSTDGRLVTPCVVVYLQPATRMGDSIDVAGDGARLTFRLISVDITDDGATACADRALNVIDTATLTVEDRALYRVKWESSSGTQRDDDVEPPAFYVSSLYSLLSMDSLDGS